MKRLCAVFALALLLSPVVSFAGPDTEGRNNDFYDDIDLVDLPGPLTIAIAGETADSGVVDLATLEMRTVMRREAFLDGDSTRFVGAYRYDGYSLFDILRTVLPEKTEPAEFDRAIDLLVVAQNDRGERVVISWGEIFYPGSPHRIIIATKAAPIVPSVTGERWPLPESTRLVFCDDLLADRSLEAPATLRIVSHSIGVETKKGLKPLFSESVAVSVDGEERMRIAALPEGAERSRYRAVFYGRGRGFHGMREFEGAQLRGLLAGIVPVDRKTLREGFLMAVAPDGYRVSISCSELLNRGDNCEFLLIERGDGDGGRFAIYPPMDFFSDRAVKALSQIRFYTIE
ncbi:MAG: hypothetical protein PHQ19_00240 [Candidatus Krumholzibacteria bacterium]|nr:hypothetical protein [Candidatus Krumholzibacteria bacterium]